MDLHHLQLTIWIAEKGLAVHMAKLFIYFGSSL